MGARSIPNWRNCGVRAVPVDARGDHDRDVGYAAALPAPHDHRVEPDVRTSGTSRSG